MEGWGGGCGEDEYFIPTNTNFENIPVNKLRFRNLAIQQN